MLETSRNGHGVRTVLGFNTLPPVDFRTRVAAAAQAGFREIGWSFLDYDPEGEASLSELRAIADGAGVRVSELKVALGFDAGLSDPRRDGDPRRWMAPGPDPARDLMCVDRRTEALLFEMATTFEVDYLVTVGLLGAELRADAARLLAVMCDRAADHDLGVALEYMPGTSVPDLATATGLVREADRPNAGILVDIWHQRRGVDDLSELAAHLVWAVQLSDGTRIPQEGDYFLDTVTNRSFPGEGDFEVAAFLCDLWTLGVDAPVSLEVLSTDTRSLPAQEVAHEAARTVDAVIDDALLRREVTNQMEAMQ